MADLRYRVVVDDAEARRRLRELLSNTGVSSQAGSGGGADDTKRAATGIAEVSKAQNSLKDAQEAAINSLRKLREERSKEIGELNTLKQLEQEAEVTLAEKKSATEQLTQAQKQANIELQKSRKDAVDYALVLKQETEERRKATVEEKKAEKAFRDAEKARKDAEKEAEKNAKNRVRRQKDLQQESSEYYQLNKALGNVRSETKDLLAEMFKMERQGRKNTVGYEILRQKAEALTKQTQYLDNGIKKIDATLGLHQRNVGNYAEALEQISPIIMDINRKLALFGTSIDQLAGKPAAIKELGAAFISMGKGILSFLLSPIGLLIVGVTALFKLFTANKQTVIDFNNGLLNVAKTTGLAGAELQSLSDAIIKLSRSLKTVSTDKLLEYATVAGQLGVKGSANILAFTEALAKLETASDISGEEGGAQIARLLTLVDGGVQNVKAFGDEIVNLGNNFPATEAEILANATRIAQATGVYKIGRQEVLAYATATKSVGVEAELVGSTMGRTLGILEKVIRTGKGVETVLKLVGGTQAELGARFRADAAGVLTDFIGGLNKVKGGAAGVNQALSAIGISAIRDRTVLGALATNGYDVLTNSLEKVRDAAGAMDEEFGTASQKLVNQSARVGIAWDNLVLSIENGQGVIGKSSIAIVGFFADIIEAITPAGSATQALTEEYIKQRNEVAATEGKIKPLLERYDELKHSGHLNTKQQKELKDIIQQIAAVMPSAVSGWNSLGEALDINRSKVLGLTEAHRELLREMNLSTTRELNQQFEQQAKMADRAFKILNNNKFDELGLERHRERFATVKNELLITAEELRSIGNTLTSEQRDVLDRYGFFNAGIMDVELPSRFKKVDNTVVEPEVDADAAKRAEEQRRQAFERQRALQLSIDAINEQASRNNLTRDQQEIASIKDKYAKIEEEVRKFYDNPKNKGFKVDMSGLQRSKDFEVSEAETRQNSTALAKSLDAQKALLDEYNAYAEATSFEAADKRFAKELELIKSYRQRIIDERAKLGAAQLTASAFGMFGAPAALTLAQQEADKALKERQEALDKEERAKGNQRMIEAMQLAETIGEGELRIRKKYTDAYAQLGKDASEEQKENLKRSYLKDLEGLVENTPQFKKALENIDKSSEAMLGNAFRKGKEVIVSMIDGLKEATDDQKMQLKKIFGDFFDEGAKNADLGKWDAISGAAQDFQGLVEASLQFASNTEDALQSLTAMLSTSNSIARTLGELFNNKQMLNISSKLGLFAPLLGVGSAISNFFNERREVNNQRVQEQVELANQRQLKSTEAVTKMLEAQLNLINEIYGDKRLEEYTKNLGDIATNYGNINNQLDGMFKMTGDAFTDNILERLNRGETKKEIENSFKKFSSEWYKAQEILSKGSLDRRDRFSSLPMDIQEARKELILLKSAAALSGDAKTQELINQLETQIDLYDRTANRLREENTGNAFSSILSDVKSLFLNSGEDAADAWSKGFDKIMENYMMQKFSRDWLEEKMQVFYEQFDQMAESGGELTDKERDQLKQNWDAIQKEGEKRVQSLRDTLKLEAGDTSSSLKSESVARQLTEATGGEIVGMYRAGYDIAKQQLNIMHSQQATQVNLLAVAQNKLIALNAIQVNTRHTVERLDLAIDQLKAVNRNLGGKYVN